MADRWTPWKSFPDDYYGEYIQAPMGPGLYEVCRASTREPVAFGCTRNVADSLCDILKPRDIEAALGTRISSDLPYDPFIYLKAVNEGVPVVIGAPRTAAADRFLKLSASAFGQDGIAVPDDGTERKSRGFLLRRR